MNRMDLIKRVTNVMREKDIRKLVSTPRKVFHISDDEGNSKDFVIKKTDKGVLFTSDDIEIIVDNILDVIMDTLKHGDEISIRGFGTLALNLREERATKHPVTGEDITIAAHYTPKFVAGKDLRMCAKIYELSIEDNIIPQDNNGDGDT